MKNEFLLAIGQLAAEKNLPRDVVLEAVEAALASAYRRDGDDSPNVYVKIDEETGEIHAYQQKAVVAAVEEPKFEISIDEARRYKPNARDGDVLDFEMKIPENAGRIAAQTAKQVVLQRLREAERDAVFEEYAGKEGELVTATVQRVEPRQIIVDLGRGTEAVLPASEQVRNEHLRSGQRIKVIILEVFKAVKGPPVIVSRGHRNLLRRLLEVEVPEVSAGTVEIKSIAREAGHRSKVAVHSRIPSVDPIGACVGMRGSRIQNIINELGGERIDIIKWDPDPLNFVSNALSPAQVVEIDGNPEEHHATAVVPDGMLSLAIGKEGQNARLAAKLAGWRIDILSQSAKDRAAAGIPEAPSTFEPVAPGEEPDLDLVAELVEPEPEPVVAAPVAPPPVTVAAREEAVPAEPEEEVTFAAALAEMEVPDREERESEDYGEEFEEEEYEVPTMVAPEERPTAIRFAEDVLPRRIEEEEEPAGRKGAAKRPRRTPRVLEEVEEDMEDIDYRGRIH